MIQGSNWAFARLRLRLPLGCLFVLLAPAVAVPSARNRQVTVVLRYDDYSAESPTGLEVRLIKALQECRIRATFAVIPDGSADAAGSGKNRPPAALTEEKAAILRSAVRAGTISVAQHGYTHEAREHRPRWVGPAIRLGEFAGLGYQAQIERIAKGKTALERAIGIPVTTFVPPGNIYDRDTLRALDHLGFRCISACQIGDTLPSTKLKFLPATAEVLRLRHYVQAARLRAGSDPIVVVMVHPYDFVEVYPSAEGMTWASFHRTLRWLSAQKDVRVLTIDQACREVGDLSALRFVENERYQSSELYLPPPLQPAYGVYLSRSTAHYLRIKPLVLAPLFYLAAALLSALIFLVIASALGGTRFARLAYGWPVLLSGLLGWSLRDLQLGCRGLLLLFLVLGAWIGSWRCARRPRKLRTQVGGTG